MVYSKMELEYYAHNVLCSGLVVDSQRRTSLNFNNAKFNCEFESIPERLIDRHRLNCLSLPIICLASYLSIATGMYRCFSFNLDFLP